MNYNERLNALKTEKEALLNRENEIIFPGNGIYFKYKNSVVSADHVPLFWEYDLNPQTNPFLMKRFAVNATFNAGAIKWKGKYLLLIRVEGADRKSFFAIAESPDGINRFTFWDHPVIMPETGNPDINVYDMRLTAHEDGWIYGIFCSERKDVSAPRGDESSAVAQAGIARTRDLVNWERLPDLASSSPQQRNVVLHPEFVQGKYLIYTRPQDGCIEAGSGGGIGYGYSDSMNPAIVEKELILDEKRYHTIYEVKNGLGPAPIKTSKGWLHLAHGVRNTAAGLRYVLYLFLTDLADPTRIIYKPAGYFLAPEGEERVGDVSNVVFSNGWIADDDNKVFIYYASSDTRLHVATSTVDQLIDYAMHTSADGFRSMASVTTLNDLINRNLALMS